MKDSNLYHSEHKIEKELREHPHHFGHVFKELDHLRKVDGGHFKHDLKVLNEHLQKKGLLPHLRIVEDGQGYSVVDESSPNPKHAAVVAKSHRSHESNAEKATYKKMHYDGWKQSADGGVQNEGDENPNASKGTVPTGSRAQLIDQALKLAGLQPTEANEKAMNIIIQGESNWNPNAINRTDSNARAGHPSQGLMQTIPSTFKQFALEGYNTNIDDPLSSMIAGARYAAHRYGSLSNVPGVKAVENGRKYVGY